MYTHRHFILFALLTALLPFQALAATPAGPEAEVIFQNRSFQQSIADISSIYGVNISIHGDCKVMPEGNFSLHLKQATIEQALKELIRKTDIQNHALLTQGQCSISLWILEQSGIMKATENPQSPYGRSEDQMGLSAEQMYLLAQNNQNNQQYEGLTPLSAEQLSQLHRQNKSMETTEDETKPLTTEQLEKLKQNSIELELKEQMSQKALTAEQMEKLKQQNAYTEEEDKQLPLSKEQMLLLQEEETQLLKKLPQN